MGFIPDAYKSILNVRDTEKAIELLRDYFQENFAKNLNLHRVSAPLFVDAGTGLNDNLSGREKAVGFDIEGIKNRYFEIVHSLAKWKRMALGKYGYNKGEGIYTNMNAIRRQEEKLDNLHSAYVDQWDWEKIIAKNERTLDYLKSTVREIYRTFKQTADYIRSIYPALPISLPQDITFVTAAELEKRFPDKTAHEREDIVCKENGAIFVIGIGAALANGEPHDLRAPDYDDWSLNGDILVWYPLLDRAVELSSMGIRVDDKALIRQLELAGVKQLTEYHKAIMENHFPLTVGGGIGQSRLCMVLLNKAHIGEVQCSAWSEETIKECEDKLVTLL